MYDFVIDVEPVLIKRLAFARLKDICMALMEMLGPILSRRFALVCLPEAAGERD
jgi:hypothetical protein